MNEEAGIDAAVSAVLSDDRAARIARDAERVEELAYYRFRGPVYEVFEIELYKEAEYILRGMLRSGSLARIALKQCKERGWKFFIQEDDMRLLRSDQAARDQVLLNVLADAMPKFLGDLKAGRGWRADYEGPGGACCLMTFFIGQCVWSFRRAYVRWAKDRVAWARQQIAVSDLRISAVLEAADYEIESEVFGTAFEEILGELEPETQAVVQLTIMGFADTEIADRVRLKHGAVRMRKTRFRSALYKAAQERRIWIPQQLHTSDGARRQNQRGAA